MSVPEKGNCPRSTKLTQEATLPSNHIKSKDYDD